MKSTLKLLGIISLAAIIGFAACDTGSGNDSGSGKSLDSISITNQPDKTTYQRGETLDITGLEVTALYSDGSQEPVAVTGAMVTGFNSTKTGAQTLTVKYNNKNAFFNITVIDNPEWETIDPVTATPGAGEVSSGKTVMLSCPTEGVEIWYTTDGSVPDRNGADSTKFDSLNPIPITEALTLNAIAFKTNWNDSPMLTAEYTVTAPNTVVRPMALPAAGAVFRGTPVTLTTETEDAEIWYTKNGTTPTNYAPSIKYITPIPVTEALNLRAIAFKEALANSTQLFASYTLVVFTVTFDSNGGTLVASKTAEGGDEPVAEPAPPTKTGYIFGGWYTDNNTFSEYYSFAEDVVKNFTLYAKWTPITYEVQYNANTGSGSMANSTHTYDAAKALSANEFTLADHAFVEWNTQANGSGTSYADSAAVTNLAAAQGAVVTLYAQWLPGYTVRYNANGGSGTMADSDLVVGQNQTLRLNAFTRTGYTFAGWNTQENGSGTSYANGATVKDLTTTAGAVFHLYAQWTAITYTVHFNSNGGNGGSTADQTHTYGASQALRTNGFTRTGYLFTGWNTQANGSGTSYTNGQSVTNLAATQGAVFNLHAQWTPITYTVRFNKNDAVAGGTMTDQIHTYDAELALSGNGFTHDTHGFLRWTANSDGTGASYNNGATVKNLSATQGAIVNLWAKWGLSYSVQYDKNAPDASGTMLNSNHEIDVAQSLTANAYTRVGYEFLKWTTNADGTGTAYNDGQSVTNLAGSNGATAILYAQWANVYTVSYNANGGTGSMANQNFVSGTPQNLRTNTFTRTGYTFKDWNTQANGSGTSYTNDQSVNNLTAAPNGSYPLYAQWTAITYSVAYNANDGSGSMSPSSHTYDVDKALTANTFTRTGYTYTGWNTQANGSGTSYANNAMVKNLASTQGATVNLYAQWVVNPVITFVLNGGNIGGNTGNIIVDVSPGTPVANPGTPARAFAVDAGLYSGTVDFSLYPPNYTFGGWYNGGTPWNFSTPVSGNITLNAQWSPVSPAPPTPIGSVAANDVAAAAGYVNNASNPAGTYTLVMGQNVTAAPQTLSRSGVTVILKGSGGERTIALPGPGPGVLLTVQDGAILQLDNNITLQGHGTNNYNLVSVASSGTLRMEAGAKISGNMNRGVAVFYSGILIMNGGTITGNHIGGVSISNNGTFTMNGGTITGNDNSAFSNLPGGGVAIGDNGTFTMNNGTISGNTATYGGGVYVGGNDTATFTMNGGTISGNTATYGGGVNVADRGRFYMYGGGTISGNNATGTGNGGGVIVTDNGVFRVANGTIYGSDESNVALRNTGPAAVLSVPSIGFNGTASRGSWDGTTYTQTGSYSFSFSSPTIKVVNGVQQP